MSRFSLRQHRSPQARSHRIAAALVAILALLVATLVAPGSAAAATYHSRTSYESWVAGKVEDRLNAERAAHGVPRVYMSTQLLASARSHDYRMSVANQLSHQLPREAPFYSRMSAAGYGWTWAGENIAYTTSIHVDSMLALQSAMYNERPPNDGHRQNILNRNFHDVGIDIYVDSAHHKLWMTVDFGHR
jgi:uncharacterized protein YkwD